MLVIGITTQILRYRERPQLGAALFSNLTTQACWVDDREGSTGRAPSKFAWYNVSRTSSCPVFADTHALLLSCSAIICRFGDSRSELSSGGVVIKHEEWTRIPLLSELRDKLETEFHTTFNAVHCSYFRNGTRLALALGWPNT